MDTVMTILLWAHIGAGTLAFGLAPAAMLTAKGGSAHRRWGKIYFWSMAVVAATALVLSLWRLRLFLTLLAVFSFYMAFTGFRALFRKRPTAGQGPAAVDWAAALLTLASSAAMAILGLLRPSPAWERMGIVPVVFGAFGIVLAGFDLTRFARPSPDRHRWWFDHMQGMLGSYIATVSAFSVVNFTFLPPVVRWLWPTVIGVPLVTLWITYYKTRLRRSPAPSAVEATLSR
jgi:hypothetical protein